MPTCRTISSGAWGHARNALVFYFSRRHGFVNAEDLAHDTLAALWNRADFEFEKEDDFLRICYAFAGHVSLASYRKVQRRATETFDAAVHDRPQSHKGVNGLSGAEIHLLLEEVMEIGSTQLAESDWTAICEAAGAIEPAGPTQPKDNSSRVRLFRARRKLAELTNWRKTGV